MKYALAVASAVVFTSLPMLSHAQTALDGVRFAVGEAGDAAAAEVERLNAGHAAFEDARAVAASLTSKSESVGVSLARATQWVREANETRSELGKLRRTLPAWQPTDVSAKPGETRGWDAPPGPEGEDFVLFVPRAVLFLPRLALQVAFWPLSQGLGLLNEYAVVENVIDFLYNDEQTAGVIPVVNFLSSQGTTFGVDAFHDDLFGHDESLSFSLRYGGRFLQAYEVAFLADRFLGTRLWLDTVVAFEATPQLFFGGIGITDAPRSVAPGDTVVGARDANVLTLYGQEGVKGVLGGGYTIGRTGELIKTGVVARLDVRDFTPAEEGAFLSTSDEWSIDDVYDTATLPGFDTSATTLGLFYTLQVDFRDSEGLRQAGPFFELFVGGAPGLDGWTYGYYGAEFAYTVDLFRRTRSLRFRASLEGVEGDDATIPFSALPALGGPDRLRGYVEGQFRDRRAGLGSVEYRYPIHNNIEGEVFLDAGYVAKDYASLVEFDRWKLGGGGGILFGSEDSIMFRLEVAHGDGTQVLFATDVARTLEGFTERP